ncbi:hypothetical protein FND36_10160 [Lachnospiraceae bacterium KGMB03038]|nr:hypothetical protein FND36_10160 [Lachnospiraceae bacterium KGMB03038]
MKYRAIISFAGQVTMRKGEERELSSSLAAPLVKCGYLEAVKAVKKKESKRNNARNNPGSSAGSERKSN